MIGEVERDISTIRLERWGRVVPGDGVVPWLVVDSFGAPVEPIRRFLRDFIARGNRPGSARSYAYGLHRWWRFLRAVGVEWDQATSCEVKDFVLWLMQAKKEHAAARTRSAATSGGINPVTRKQYLGDGYQPRTIRHSNAVIRTFYEFWIDMGARPLVNPVQQRRHQGRRPNVHHNPLEPFRPEGRLRYNPPLPRRRVRAHAR
jgi:integrase/recombinase XerD